MTPSQQERPDAPGWRVNLVVLLFVACAWIACFQFPVVWRATGIGQTSEPFLDLYGLLASGEMAHAHGNPYRPNPLDPFNRPHLYSAWWLVSGTLGLTRADAGWLGLGLVGLTLVASVALVRPRRPVEAIQTALVLCSPAMLLAINRGNNDLEILILVCAALCCLRAERNLPRICGVVLLAVAAVLKYFPLVTLVVLFSARTRREFLAGLGLFVLVVAAGWPAMKPGLESVAHYKPHPDGLYAFGAPTVFRDFGIQTPVYWLALTGIIGAWSAWLVYRRWKAEPAGTSDSATGREFACGAVLLIGGFFLGASYLYKLIFAVCLLPWFWRQRQAPEGERWRRAAWWVLVGVVWSEGVLAVVVNLVIYPRSLEAALRVLDATYIFSQLLTWILMICLLPPLISYCVGRARFLLRPENGGAGTA